MNTLIPAVRAEFLKITTTRLWWVLALILFAYVAVMAGGIGALIGAQETGLLPEGSTNTQGLTLDPTLIYSFGSSLGFVFPVIFAAMAVTQEFRHKTITPTFLATPARGNVLAAKAVVLFAWGAFYGIVAALAAGGVGAATLAAFGSDTGLEDPATWALLGRMVIALALWGVIGVGLGSLIPSQIGSIVTIVVFTQFVEPILRFASSLTDWTGEIGKFLPGAASDALVGASFYSMVGATSSLPWWGGGLALLGLAIASVVGGYFVSWRRDVS